MQSKHFKLSEFKCKCGKCQVPANMPPQELVDILDDIREHFGVVVINSGYRCPEHNAKIGGAKSSRHTFGDAVDIVVKGVKTLDIYNYVIAKYDSKPYGIAKKITTNPYGGFVHIDTRGTKRARWNYPGSIM